MINGSGSDNGYFAFEITTRSGQEIVTLDWDQQAKVEAVKRWVLFKDAKGRKFARSDKQDGQVLLHRHLFDMPKGSRLEWINGNTLDLRRENLQLVDREGNITPLAEPKQEAVEDFLKDHIEVIVVTDSRKEPLEKGVVLHKHSKKYTSRPFLDGKRYSLGYFDTAEEANAQTRIFRAEGPESPKLKRNQRKGNN